MAQIFIDSGAFVALAESSDRYHQAAFSMYDSVMAAGHKLVTTNHIMDEVSTWLLRNSRTGHKAAARFGASILESGALVAPDDTASLVHLPHRLFVIYSTPVIERRAWAIFNKYDTTGFSFTDCVSFAVMEAMKIKQAFTFDKHFDTMGFERTPSLNSQP